MDRGELLSEIHRLCCRMQASRLYGYRPSMLDKVALHTLRCILAKEGD